MTSTKNIFDLSGKVALITGASRGLGCAFAQAMAEFGADVACAGRNQTKLSETLDLVGRYGHRAIAISADISLEAEVQEMVAATVRQLGKIDIFFNNAGTTTPLLRIHETPVRDWDEVININLRGMFLGLKYVLPEMIKHKQGSIINTSSIAGLRAEIPQLGPAAYGASKAAIINLTQVAAMEYVADGIRVNCIAPGMHRSDLGRGNASAEDQERIERMIQSYCKAEVPMGRLAEASELKGLAVLLASDASSYITGQVFVQDGGQSARI